MVASEVEDKRPIRRQDVEAAAGEGYRLERAGHPKPLYLRRLILAGEHTKRSSSSSSSSSKGIGKKRNSTGGHPRLATSVGAIFGSTLKSVLEFSGVAPTKGHLLRALRHLVRFLQPVGESLVTTRGDDRAHLALGLAVRRVSSAQRKHLTECVEPPHARSYMGRAGIKDVAFGATAAILCAHYIMSMEGADAATVVEGLDRCCNRVSDLLSNWPVSARVGVKQSVSALQAEARALCRARAAACAAATMATAQQLGRDQALQLQFEWMRRAAWPRGTTCDESSHVALCEALASGGGLPTEPDAPAVPLPSMPLSALPSAVWVDSGATDASSTDSGSRSGSLASSASSIGDEAEVTEDPALSPEDAIALCERLGL